MDPDPDPAIFVIDLQDASKKLIFNTIFSTYYFLKVHLHHFSKIKSQKESQNRRNQGFSSYFCMMIEGAGSGSIHLTSGSGSGSRRPKNMWIRWIKTLLIIVFSCHRCGTAVDNRVIDGGALIKKKKKFPYTVYKNIQKGAIAKSYLTNGIRI
jgi:hypothetical protein